MRDEEKYRRRVLKPIDTTGPHEEAETHSEPRPGIAPKPAKPSGTAKRRVEPFTLDELTLCTDVRPADWAVSAALPFDENTVGCILPPVFATYARLFHPARRTVDDAEQEGSWRDAGQEVPWREVALANGRVPHPGMQWPYITGSWSFVNDEQPGVWNCPPEEGTLPLRQITRLVHLLAPHTTTPERCWFAVWEGFGDLDLPTEDEEIPRVEMPARSMLLLEGPLRAATTSLSDTPWWGRYASLWWPQDRAWCVATDVDLMSTYIGGSMECVTALLADEELEIMEIPLDQRLGWNGDTVNPPPTGKRPW
ncbi:hypothetical protein ACFQ08_07660 [Streptosporangium algeriense]|uniref:DUF2716 domain-containing protein n=1 Tax=Streptosporangium algeriense TaxID=1682748 RepID=A0ABW3DML6_9ACTN